jgi:pyruvate/oxaloacetate carboxyltransferase
MRNGIERFFRYLKEMTAVFHHKMSAKDYTGNKEPKTIRTILSSSKNREVSEKCLSGHHQMSYLIIYLNFSYLCFKISLIYGWW